MRHSLKNYTSRGIYLIPNLFTTAGLFAAFYAIVAAMHQQFSVAAIAIFVAMIADALDGRIARYTNTQTAFGAEYDSLADMTSFGIAPALVIYSCLLNQNGKVGWLVAFIYCACTALRLARYNTQIGVADKRYFQGLPSPAAALLIASFVWMITYHHYKHPAFPIIGSLITLVVAILMVSKIRYYSFKELEVSKRMPLAGGLAVVIFFVALSLDPPVILFGLSLAYVCSGFIVTWLYLQKTKQLRHKNKHHSPSSK